MGVMTPLEQRIEIAKILGYKPDLWGDKKVGIIGWKKDEVYISIIPDFLNNFGAMHTAWSTLKGNELVRADNHLFKICGSCAGMAHPTAAQWAEAFLKAHCKWVSDV